MLSQAMLELFKKTQWPETDYLIVDMPPGTGDIALSLSGKTPITAAIIVSTSQRVAHDDVCRTAAMWKKLDVPVLGLINNMQDIECPHCHHHHALFPDVQPPEGLDALEKLATLPFLPDMAMLSDQGKSYVLENPKAPLSRRMMRMAENITKKLSHFPHEKPLSLSDIPVEQSQ